MRSLHLLPVFVVVSLACGTSEPAPAGDPGRGGDPNVSAGDPALGDPVAGDPAGDPFAGDPPWGDPGGDPGAGDPSLLTPCGIVFPPVVVLEATVLELYTAINAAEELAVVDVRESFETTGGIIEGALLYPWSGGVGGTLQTQHATLPDDRPLYIVCASGTRSRIAADWLVDNGHTCVYTVLGGMGAWSDASYPTVSP